MNAVFLQIVKVTNFPKFKNLPENSYRVYVKLFPKDEGSFGKLNMISEENNKFHLTSPVTWNFQYQNALTTNISLHFFAGDTCFADLRLPLAWFEKNSVVTYFYPARFLINFPHTKKMMVKLAIHLSENNEAAFSAPKGHLLVTPAWDKTGNIRNQESPNSEQEETDTQNNQRSQQCYYVSAQPPEAMPQPKPVQNIYPGTYRPQQPISNQQIAQQQMIPQTQIPQQQIIRQQTMPNAQQQIFPQSQIPQQQIIRQQTMPNAQQQNVRQTQIPQHQIVNAQYNCYSNPQNLNQAQIPQNSAQIYNSPPLSVIPQQQAIMPSSLNPYSAQLPPSSLNPYSTPLSAYPPMPPLPEQQNINSNQQPKEISSISDDEEEDDDNDLDIPGYQPPTDEAIPQFEQLPQTQTPASVVQQPNNYSIYQQPPQPVYPYPYFMPPQMPLRPLIPQDQRVPYAMNVYSQPASYSSLRLIIQHQQQLIQQLQQQILQQQKLLQNENPNQQETQNSIQQPKQIKHKQQPKTKKEQPNNEQNNNNQIGNNNEQYNTQQIGNNNEQYNTQQIGNNNEQYNTQQIGYNNGQYNTQQIGNNNGQYNTQQIGYNNGQYNTQQVGYNNGEQFGLQPLPPSQPDKVFIPPAVGYQPSPEFEAQQKQQQKLVQKQQKQQELKKKKDKNAKIKKAKELNMNQNNESTSMLEKPQMVINDSNGLGFVDKDMPGADKINPNPVIVQTVADETNDKLNGVGNEGFSSEESLQPLKIPTETNYGIVPKKSKQPLLENQKEAIPQ